MKTKPILIFLTLCAMLGVVGFRMQEKHPDLTTPKSVVRSFVDGLSRRDFKYMAECVQDAQAESEVEQLFGTMPKMAFELGNLVAEVDGEKAHVAMELRNQISLSDDPGAQTATVTTFEMFELQKQGDAWHILPDPEIRRFLVQPEAQQVGRQVVTMRPLGAIATMLGGGKDLVLVLQKVQEQAKLTTCISNQKQIAVGILMYSQDYDEMFPRKRAPYVDLVMPYIKNKDVFTCPLDGKGTISYTMNANLQGLSLAALVAPAKTIMLYEGKNMQISYRHNGKAIITFADGSVKMLGPEETRSLFWYAEGSKPAPAKPAKKPHAKTRKKK